MWGLILRLLAYAAIISGFIIEWGNFDWGDFAYRHLSGSLISGGVVILLVLAFTRAWKTRGRMD